MSVIPENIIVLPNLDLKNGESLELALSNLAQLEHQFSKICSNLDQRLANLKGKLGGINQRIGASRQKVETLKDINEAITIVSPSKFVRVYKKGQDITYHFALNPDYVNNRRVAPFNYENNMNLNTNIRKDGTPGANSTPGLLNQGTAGNSHQGHDDELRKIVKLSRGMFNTKRELFSGSLSVQNQRFYGLGRIPRDIKYIDSLVVFNSKHNPYQKYVNIDNTVSNTGLNVRKKQNKEKDKINITEAPTTLVEGDMLTQFGTEDHRFRPEAKVLPQLVAPSQLGLKGIVSINLGNYEVDGLTPSKGGTVNRPTVPDPKFTDQKTNDQLMDPSLLSMQRFSNVTSGQDNSNANMQNSTVNQNQNMAQSTSGYTYAPTISQNRSVNIQAPQVSAPQPTMTTSTYNANQRPNVSQPQVTQAAPVQQTNTVPAPVTNAGPGTQAAPANTAQAAAPKAAGKAGGGRAALLDEIRNPKVKLKKAAPVEEEKPSLERKGASSKPAPALNHLDHLKQQIQLRFQALNKNKKKEESSDEEDDE